MLANPLQALTLSFLRHLQRLRRPLAHPLQTTPPPPIPGLPPQERAHRTQVALVPQEIRPLGAAAPELDSVAERVHGLAVAADEGPAKVDV
jgi:hypothetical protein